MNKDTKRYLVSSLITFASAFIIAIASVADTITIDNISKSAILGLIITGVRAGIKAIAELIVKE